MLMSHSSSCLYHQIPNIKPYFGKYFTKHQTLFSANHPKTNGFTFSTKNGKKYSSKSCCHLPAAVDTQDVGAAGIGILQFFEGKNIFLTGVTGFLGKVLVEKLLRSTSVGKVYLLVKAEDKEAAFERLKCEIINSMLFTSLKEKYGTAYEAFVWEKLIPIFGDISKPNLGMDYESIDAIRKDVHIIIHSAASTAFNERYDLLVDTNVIAPQRVMRFAKTCNKLQIFTHISTAYVNGRKEGMIIEKPWIMGENGVDFADEISLLLKSSANYDDSKFFQKLGQRRAEELGWSNTYQLTKAMGEMSLNEIKGNIRLLIIRPSIVESCYHEPVTGWIQGMRMCDPVIISYAKGLLPAFYANPQTLVDLIPVDFVANTTIAAIAKHGNMADMTQPCVYHVGSSHLNHITVLNFFDYLYEYFKTTPLIESSRITKTKFFDDFDEFSEYAREEISRHCRGGEDRKRMREINAKIEYAEQLCKMYDFVAFFKSRFHTGNTEKLIEEMSKEEQFKFEVDVKKIIWKKYLQEIHIPGLIKYVFNSPRATS